VIEAGDTVAFEYTWKRYNTEILLRANVVATDDTDGVVDGDLHVDEIQYLKRGTPRAPPDPDELFGVVDGHGAVISEEDVQHTE
jgi:hypothetical protein